MPPTAAPTAAPTPAAPAQGAARTPPRADAPRSAGFPAPPGRNSFRSNPLIAASRPEVLERLAGLGERALPRELDGGRDFFLDAGFHPRVPLRGEEPLGGEPRTEALDRAGLPGRGDLLSSAIVLRIVG